MPPKGSRHQVAPGIYADGTGFQAQVNGGRGPGNTRRYPPDTDLRIMQAWQRRRRVELTITPPAKPESQRGTLKADIPRRLALIPEGPSRNTQDSYLAPWLATSLASRPRADITREDVKRQLAQWGTDGYAASTLNHRLSALRSVYRELDGDDAPNPCDGIKKFREPDAEPRGVPIVVAQTILDAIKDRGGKRKPILQTKARLRLAVILYTGLPHAQVMRIKPEHIDWDGGTLLTTPRRKGTGAKARRIPLLPQAVDALRAVDGAGCYGDFSTSPVRRAWERARDAVAADITDPQIAAVLRSMRPYDLRHSFGAEVYRHSGDHRATAELLLHAPGSKLTERYTLAAVSETAARALAAVAARSSSASRLDENRPDSGGAKGSRSRKRPVKKFR